MSEDPPPYNPLDHGPVQALTENAPSGTVLAIDAALAQRVCLAVAQVLHAGYGRVEVTIKHHQVHMLYTTISEEIR